MGKFSDQVMRFSVKAPEVALNVIRASVIELATRIIVRTPVDTGRARAGWQLSIGAPTTTSPTDYEWTTKGEEGGRIASEAIARVTGAAGSITPGTKKSGWSTMFPTSCHWSTDIQGFRLRRAWSGFRLPNFRTL